MVQRQRKQKDTKKIKPKARYLEKKYIAIDPGKSGGVAVLHEDYVGSYICTVEKVHAFPTDARSSAFKFGTNYGAWIGILESNNVEYELVMPRVWQRDFNLPKIKKERKQELKKIAKCFHEKATLYTSDAICIAIWRRANDG